jgi:hypothetical protein
MEAPFRQATARRVPFSGVCAAAVAILLAAAVLNGAGGQTAFRSGQDITPAFDGWEANPDGTFNLCFGYFNRNWDEELDIPIGPNNNVEPGGPDQGQPTHFFPRRNRYVFRVKVPKDFGNKEIVWTLTHQGKTHRTYGTLKPEYITDNELQQFDIGDFGHNNERLRANKRPVVRVEGETTRTVKVGEPLTLTATANDDGIPPPIPAPIRLVGRHGAWGLRVAWFVYRGPAKHVAFDPEQFKIFPDYRANTNSPWTPGWSAPPLPSDGKFPVKVTFRAPGTYVVRVQAHDGGLDSAQDVTVTVTGGPVSSGQG